MITIATKLSVKELAPALGKSVGYIYKMRMAGFTMEWDFDSKCFVSTPSKAKRWIKREKFRLLRGGVKKG